MHPQLIATSLVALATFALAPVSASAQSDPQGALDVTDAQTETFVGQHLDLSAGAHDDWAVAPAAGRLLHHPSPREHEASLLAPDLSPRSRDNWAVAAPAS
jgi:hypothetical protein